MLEQSYKCPACLDIVAVFEKETSGEFTCPKCLCVTPCDEAYLIVNPEPLKRPQKKSLKYVSVGAVLLLVLASAVYFLGARSSRSFNKQKLADIASKSATDPNVDYVEFPTASKNTLDTFSSTNNHIQEDIASIFERSRLSVATILTGTGQGSGVCVEIDGRRWVITNRHVLESAQSLDSIRIVGDFGELKIADARYSSTVDVAFLELSKSSAMTPLAIATIEPPIGESILCIGSTAPEIKNISVGRFRLTQGIVSNYVRIDDQAWIEVTAALSPGMSGGPVVDRNGNLIGLNVAGIKDQSKYADGFYVVPISEILRVSQNPQDLLSFNDLLAANSEKQAEYEREQRQKAIAINRARRQAEDRRAAALEAEKKLERSRTLYEQFKSTRDELAEIGFFNDKTTLLLMPGSDATFAEKSAAAQEAREWFQSTGVWTSAAELSKICQEQINQLRASRTYRKKYIDLMYKSYLAAVNVCDYTIAPTEYWTAEEMFRQQTKYNLIINKLNAWQPDH
jgi:S1-C subfamily serine protease